MSDIDLSQVIRCREKLKEAENAFEAARGSVEFYTQRVRDVERCYIDYQVSRYIYPKPVVKARDYVSTELPAECETRIIPTKSELRTIDDVFESQYKKPGDDSTVHAPSGYYYAGVGKAHAQDVTAQQIAKVNADLVQNIGLQAKASPVPLYDADGSNSYEDSPYRSSVVEGQHDD